MHGFTRIVFCKQVPCGPLAGAVLNAPDRVTFRGPCPSGLPLRMRAKFEKVIRDAQDSICAAIEEVDGKKFQQDAWTRADGGGGISRVLQDGNVWEKAGVNVSVVYGSMPPEAYR